MVAGLYLEVKPNEKVVFTWGWTGSDSFPPGSSTVEIQFGNGMIKKINTIYGIILRLSYIPFDI